MQTQATTPIQRSLVAWNILHIAADLKDGHCVDSDLKSPIFPLLVNEPLSITR